MSQPVARRSTSWQVGGDAMHSLLYPVCNEREAMRRQGLKPKDHAKENRRRLEELQRQKVIVTCLSGCAFVIREHGIWIVPTELVRLRDSRCNRFSTNTSHMLPMKSSTAANARDPSCVNLPLACEQTEAQRPPSNVEPFKMQRFKETKSQVRRWIQEEGYLNPHVQEARVQCSALPPLVGMSAKVMETDADRRAEIRFSKCAGYQTLTDAKRSFSSFYFRVRVRKCIIRTNLNVRYEFRSR